MSPLMLRQQGLWLWIMEECCAARPRIIPERSNNSGEVYVSKCVSVCLCVCLFVCLYVCLVFLPEKKRKHMWLIHFSSSPLITITYLLGQFSWNLMDRSGLKEPIHSIPLTAKQRIVTLILSPPVLERKVGRTAVPILSGSWLQPMLPLTCLACQGGGRKGHVKGRICATMVLRMSTLLQWTFMSGTEKLRWQWV